MAATHRDLPRMAAEGTFRHDLLARLEAVLIVLPPLRERPEDVSLLIANLLRRLAGNRQVKLTPQAALALLEHDWPLNVRELEQALAGALALSETGVIGLQHLPQALRKEVGEPPPDLTAEQLRHREELAALLRDHKGNLAAIARALGKGRTQILRWVRRYRLDASAYRPG